MNQTRDEKRFNRWFDELDKRPVAVAFAHLVARS